MDNTAIEVWHVEDTVLTDGSKVFDVIGASDDARVVFNCVDEAAAYNVQAMLNHRHYISGASAEALGKPRFTSEMVHEAMRQTNMEMRAGKVVTNKPELVVLVNHLVATGGAM